MDINNIEQVRSFFSNDKYAADCGCFIEEIGERYAKCTVNLTDNHRNAVGGVMGAVYFTLADFTFAAASNAYLDNPDVVSISSNISFLNYCKGKVLTAEAVCIKDGRTTCYYEVNVTDDLGKRIALVTITGCHTGR